MKKILIALAAGALVLLGWWVGGGEFVRSPELRVVMAASVSAVALVFLLMRDL